VHDPDADTQDLTEALAALRVAPAPCGCWHHQHTLAPHADRLCRGTTALRDRGLHYISAGGWRSALWRIAGIGAAGWLGWRVAEQAPYLLAPSSIAWCVAAWRAGAPGPVVEPSCEERRRILVVSIEQMMGDRLGLHLAELYDRLRERPALAHLADRELRAALDHYRIPVRPQVRSGDRGGRSGIHLDGLAPPLDGSGPLPGCVEPVTCDVDQQPAAVEGP
jgi:hypothetical protein